MNEKLMTKNFGGNDGKRKQKQETKKIIKQGKYEKFGLNRQTTDV